MRSRLRAERSARRRHSRRALQLHRLWLQEQRAGRRESVNETFDVVIAGGGPAGSSAATHLAMRGARVLLAEQKKFPREKLCGEFISPECAVHFERLGVIDRMLAAGPARLDETVFYARNGKSVSEIGRAHV